MAFETGPAFHHSLIHHSSLILAWLTYPQTVKDQPAADQREPLLLVVGPTASGKSRLGLEVAEALGGEIISADAFAVYRGLDIGTDKPDADDRGRVRHHLIDVAEPTEVFSAGAFVEAATNAINEIRGRGMTPVVVGGTHFWIRALLLGLFPSPPRDPELVARLAEAWAHDPISVFRRLEEIDPEAAAKIAPGDRQRILRAIEVFEATLTPDFGTLAMLTTGRAIRSRARRAGTQEDPSFMLKSTLA